MKVGIDVLIDSDSRFTRPELVSLGNHVAIDRGFYCTTGLKIGDYVHVSPYVAVIGGRHTYLEIQDFCFISVGARMICGSELFQGDGLIGPLIPDEFKDQQILEPITLKRFSGVCANSTVMSGVTMAEGSILGANSFLKTNTEPWTIYAGNPARPIKSRKSHIMIDYAKRLGYNYEQ
jgi:acetyltransferase-like isoleucine patch superfamily enzyme